MSVKVKDMHRLPKFSVASAFRPDQLVDDGASVAFAVTSSLTDTATASLVKRAPMRRGGTAVQHETTANRTTSPRGARILGRRVNLISETVFHVPN